VPDYAGLSTEVQLFLLLVGCPLVDLLDMIEDLQDKTIVDLQDEAFVAC
jgi:hypothetical protein